jgi:hypothetical protein
MSATNRKGHRARRDGNYSTPLWAVDIVLPYLPRATKLLDPCAGSGNILRAAAAYYRRYELQAEIYGIELDPERAEKVQQLEGVSSCRCANAMSVGWQQPDQIVMNPPFQFAEVFVRRALNSVAPHGTVAVLLRMAFAAGIARAGFWQNRMADMAILSKRPSFDKICGSSHDSADYAWFIFSPNAVGRWFRLEVEPCRNRAQTFVEKSAEPSDPTFAVF